MPLRYEERTRWADLLKEEKSFRKLGGIFCTICDEFEFPEHGIISENGALGCILGVLSRH